MPATKPLPPNLNEIAARASASAGPSKISFRPSEITDPESPRSSATSTDEEICLQAEEEAEGDSSSIASTSVYDTDETPPPFEETGLRAKNLRAKKV